MSKPRSNPSPARTMPEPFRLRPSSAGVRSVLAAGMMAGCLGSPAAELPVPQDNWVGVGQATREVVGNTMNITQQAARVRLNWKSFDIGAGNTVNFRQPDASAIALNKIDATGRPSQILGALNANGQIYLVNPDGVVFGRGSRVDVGSLVTTNLDITDEVLAKGLTKGGQDINDLYPALQGNGEIFLIQPQTGEYVRDAAGNKLKVQVVVDKDAIIKTASGGRVIIAAPEVVNQGSIETPQGQTILAGATDRVYLQEDTNLGGLLVEVQTGGKVDNIGSVLAKQGNATLLGFAVNQQGRVSASTSVRVGGSVRLLAREGGGYVQRNGVELQALGTTRANAGEDGLGKSANVILGPGSITEVLPDLEDSTTAGIKEAQPRSRIEIAGGKVDVQSQARVQAPAGNINITAFNRVLVRKGATIDASGLKDVQLSVARNYLTQEVRRNELRDSPLQRVENDHTDLTQYNEQFAKDNVLFGKIVQFDKRKPPSIVDVSGAMDRDQETIAERSTAGGSISITAPEVILQRDSKLDVSGGSLAYQSAKVQVTQLVDVRGNRINIDKADPNTRYRAIVGDVKRPGEQASGGFTARSYVEQGYIEGKNAGSVEIKADSLLADGRFVGGTREGIYQRELAKRPQGGRLILDLTNPQVAPRDLRIDANKTIYSDGLDLDSLFPEDPQAKNLSLTPEDLQAGAFRHIALKVLGKVTLTASTRLHLPTHGSLTLGEAGKETAVLELLGEIDAASGSLTAYSRGATLGAQARIDVSGSWLNERRPFTVGTSPVALDGGSVLIRSEGNVTVQAGAQIKADGGAWLNSAGKLQEGRGGSITLAARGPVGSNLDIDGATLSAFALHHGGTLDLQSNSIVISKSAPFVDPNATLHPLWLPPDFFQRGGFQDFRLTANHGDAVIKGNTRLDLVARNWFLPGNYARLASQRSLAGRVSEQVLLPHERRPVDFSLSLLQLPSQLSTARSLIVEQGAEIFGDRGARLGFSADTRVLFDGLAKTPAGTIALSIIGPEKDEDLFGFRADQGIFLGSHAALLAPGTTVERPNTLGYRFLDAYDGGSVSLLAEQGFVVAATGSRIDVSGVFDSYDRRLGTGAASGVRRETLATAGGKISVLATEGLLIDATMTAGGGNATRRGGSLSLALYGNRLDARNNSAIRNIQGQEEFPVASGLWRIQGFEGGVIPGGWIPGDNLPQAVFREARISGRRIEDGDFSDVSVAVYTPPSLNGQSVDDGEPRDEIRFEGNVTLSPSVRLELAAPILAWGEEGQAGTVSLNTAYLRLGAKNIGKDQEIRQTPITPGSGNGRLETQAKLIDLVGGVALDGFGSAQLASRGDIRAIGVRNSAEQRDFVGELVISGTLTLQADQIYPTTLSRYRLAALGDAGRIEIRGNGAGEVAPPLSAGGSLSVEAADIVQGGVLRAPFGHIEFRRRVDDAGNVVQADRLTLSAGSVTSVSGQGLNVPFGRTSESGGVWLYPFFDSDQNLLASDAPTDKQVDLSARVIDFAQGARIDLSGGGELSAYEFAGKGPGGSYDVLSPDDPRITQNRAPFEPKFAILPSYKGQYAPYDPLEFRLAETYGLNMGQTVYLTGAGGLAGGEYVLLPARYALLPDAYLVTPVAGIGDMLAGEVRIRADGTPITSGYFGVSGVSEQTASGYWQGFLVQPGSFARQQSQFIETSVSDFLSGSGQATGDAGAWTLDARERLNLQGILDAQAASNGRAARVDVSAHALKVVDRLSDTPPDGVVEVLASDLSRLKPGSLLLGGKRLRGDDDTTRVDVLSTEVMVDDGVSLLGPEIILTAADRVTIGDNATLRAEGAKDAKATGFKLDDASSTLLRVSTSDLQAVTRGDANGGGLGALRIGNGAVVQAPGSINIDATGDVTLLGTVDVNGGGLGLGGQPFNIGAVPTGATGFNLNADFLSRFDATSLFLRSSEDVRLYGAANLAAIERLRIDAPGLAGFDNAGQTASLSVKAIQLLNASGAASVTTGNGSGTLTVSAEEIRLGEGDFTVSGFAGHSMNASRVIRGEGDGRALFAGDVSLDTPLLMSEAGASTQILAGNHRIELRGGERAVDASLTPGWGGLWRFEGGAIDHDTRIVTPSGSVSFLSEQTLRLGANATVDVAARALAYRPGLLVPVAGGSVRAYSAQGDVILEQGARIDVAGLAGLSDGGSLNIGTPSGRLHWNGTITASAGAGFQLDAQDLGGFATLYGQMRQAGFDGRLDLRQRGGDIEVNGDQPGVAIKARELKVVADQGNIDITGAIDLRGEKGGEGQFWAGKTLRMTADARIDAQATGAAGRGGRLTLAGGEQVTVAAGARIDVSGGTQGTGGEVTVRAPRLGSDDAAVDLAGGTVIGAKSTQVEAVRIYDNQAITTTNLNTWRTDTTNWMNAALANAGLTARLGGYTLTPGIEVRSDGTVDLNQDVDFSAGSWRFGPDKIAGTFTVRVAGDFNLNKSLSDGFALGYVPGASQIINNRIASLLQTGTSWSYRLVAGADLTGADALAVNAGGGDLTLASGVRVRTGTGDIAVATGGAFKLADQTSVLYTAGRPVGEAPAAATDAANKRYGSLSVQNLTLGNSGWYAEFPIDGGDIRIDARGDIQGAVSSQLMTNWLVRQGAQDQVNPTALNTFPTAWGIAFDVSNTVRGSVATSNVGFQQNIGALGGGDVSIRAGGAIADLSVMIPTTGKPLGRYDNSLRAIVDNDVILNGGGDLSVEAGGDIRGGVYFVDRGDASIKSGGSVAGGSKLVEFAPVAPAGLLLGVADSSVSVAARKDLAVSSVFDPYWLKPIYSKGVYQSYFTRYGDDAGVQLSAAGGDLVLANDLQAIKDQYVTLTAQREPNGNVFTESRNDFALRTYPGTLKAYAGSGDLRIQRSFTLMPAPLGQLELVAGGSLRSDALGDRVFVQLSDADRALLAGPGKPIGTVASLDALSEVLAPEPLFEPQRSDFSDPNSSPAEVEAEYQAALARFKLQSAKRHALTPVHLNDERAVILAALGGGILGQTEGGDPLAFTLPKRLLASARDDISGVSFKVQHVSSLDASVIQGGGDIKYEIPRNRVTGELQLVEQRIEVAGPGTLDVIAGKSVDLGTSVGIRSIGDRENPSLADSGASLNVFAALPQGLALDGFITKYLVADDFYTLDLALYLERKHFGVGVNGSAREQAYVQQLQARYPDFTARLHSNDEQTRLTALNDAVALFQSLAPEQKTEFVLRMLFSEIRLASTAAAVKAGRLEFAAALDRLRVADWKQDMDGSATPSSLSLSGKTLENRLAEIVARPKDDFSGYEDAETAIETLFPKATLGTGDIRLFTSAILTEDGGDDDASALADTATSLAERSALAFAKDYARNDSDINLITLGGLMNLGQPPTVSTDKRESDQIGVITKGDGTVNALVDGDFLVNRSRFVANSGGDAVIYSRNSNIDAGLGSNSAFAAQQAVYAFDEFGRFLRTYLPSVAGSGPQANAPFPERRGNVFLGVPKGQVFISEAGITGDSVVAPALVGNTAFVNTSSPAGGSATAVAAIPTDVGSVASNAARAATDSAAQSGNDDDKKKSAEEKSGNGLATTVETELVGFGECSVSDVRDGKAGCGGA